MNYILLAIGVAGLGLGAFFIARSPKFWIELVKEVANGFLPAFLKILQNRPKTPEEWKDWRELSAMRKADMSPKQKARYEELKKLNSEWKK